MSELTPGPDHAAEDEEAVAEPLPTPSLWTRLNLSEPVRLRLYGVLVPVVALLVAYGVLDAAAAPLWLAVGAAVLGAAATEATRRSVVSPETASHVATMAALTSPTMDPLSAAALALNRAGVPAP